jgi:hypothetical protein
MGSALVRRMRFTVFALSYTFFIVGCGRISDLEIDENLAPMERTTKLRDLGLNRDLTDNFEWNRTKMGAEKGNTKDMLILAVAWYNCNVLATSSRKEGIKWFKLLAEQGHAGAQFNLGCIYKTGLGVPQNYKEAIKWFRLSAEQEMAKSQFNLGMMYIEGLGVPKDYKEAAKMFKLAAEQGYVNGQHNLAYMYKDGHGVSKDEVKAYAWYNVAEVSGRYESIKFRKSIDLSSDQIADAQSLSTEFYNRIEANKKE